MSFSVVVEKATKVKSLTNPIYSGIYLVINSPCPETLADRTGHSVWKKRNKAHKMSRWGKQAPVSSFVLSQNHYTVKLSILWFASSNAARRRGWWLKLWVNLTNLVQDLCIPGSPLLLQPFILVNGRVGSFYCPSAELSESTGASSLQQAHAVVDTPPVQ